MRFNFLKQMSISKSFMGTVMHFLSKSEIIVNGHQEEINLTSERISAEIILIML